MHNFYNNVILSKNKYVVRMVSAFFSLCILLFLLVFSKRTITIQFQTIGKDYMIDPIGTPQYLYHSLTAADDHSFVYKDDTIGISYSFQSHNNYLKRLLVYIVTKSDGVSHFKNFIQFGDTLYHIQFDANKSYILPDIIESPQPLPFDSLTHAYASWNTGTKINSKPQCFVTILEFFPISPTQIPMENFTDFLKNFSYTATGYF